MKRKGRDWTMGETFLREDGRCQKDVAICIATCRRPEGLKRLLMGIRRALTDDARYKVVVVDNDANGSARHVAEEAEKWLPCELVYVIEERPGIPFARNTSVLNAGPVDFVAFIDDDEEPETQWISELLKTQEEYSADVVAGPVVPEFEERAPLWAKKGRFFERNTYATGTVIRGAATNNVLVKKEVFDTVGLFEPRFALTGGSDTEFFMRVRNSGFRMVWSNEAIVREWIPVSRANVRWVLRRAFRTGYTSALCDVRANGWRGLVARLVVSFFRLAQGLMWFLPSLFLGKHSVVRSLWFLAKATGIWWGLFGRDFEEYRVIHNE